MLTLPALWGFWYWPRFLIAVSVLFLGPELYAVATNSANTLSDYSWTELGIGNAVQFRHVHTAAWWLSLAAWVLFVVVITAHIWWRQRIGHV